MIMNWHYGDIFDAVGGIMPASADALIHVEPATEETGAAYQVINWSTLRAHSNRLARASRDAGLVPGDKVAHYLRNVPAYLTTFVACSKARLAHVNVNYRYKSEELHYLLQNADCAGVVYAAEFAAQIAALRPRLPGIRWWIEAGPGPIRNGFAMSYEAIIAHGSIEDLQIDRAQDDLHLVYTGGTTGTPKGVMWRHADLWTALGGGGSNATGVPPAVSLQDHIGRVSASPQRPRQMPLNPLMHGAGLMTALTALAQGGCVVTLGGTRFSASAALEAIVRHRVSHISMVGDAFGRPLLDELERHPGRHDLRGLQVVVSTGAMWSAPVKAGLLSHAPHLLLFDALGSSESVGFGTSSAKGTQRLDTASFKLGAGCKVFDEHLREVPPGSATPGFLARSGPIPLGYYKDPKRTAKTFPVIDGVRYAMPGDYCLLGADGTLTLLGRASGVINTGGEKVFAEEVEEALKLHPQVEDALVIGWPSERWGQVVVAVAQLDAADVDSDHEAIEEALRSHVRTQLADYKAPRRIVLVAALPRAANGKPDYALARDLAAAALRGIAL